MSPTRGTSPTFQVYAFDLMAMRSYRMMTLAERGLYLSMLCECWANIEIPANPEELAALLGKQGQVEAALTPRLLSFFERTESGFLISPDIEKYRKQVIEQRARMSEGGSRGGKKRIENERKAKEASSLPSNVPSKSNQAPLKGRESESEAETEKQSIGSVLTTAQLEWKNDYERASNGG